jgi:pilus assembly protein FimV
MKKMVFFVLLLAFSRVGVALGMGPTPVGIGNFFLGSPSITESNFNQVLGLLVGPAGSPGVAGVSGANGKDGLNGLAGISGVNGVNGVDGAPGTAGAQGVQGVAGIPGTPGTPGTPGAQGVAGPAGPAGAPGTGGGGGFFGVGGGNVSVGTCDDSVNVNVTQSFQGSKFDWATTVVSNIAGISGTSKGCAGQYATMYVSALGSSFSCTIALDPELRGPSNSITFNTTNCPGLRGVDMKILDSNIGLEFTENRVS